MPNEYLFPNSGEESPDVTRLLTQTLGVAQYAGSLAILLR